MYDLAIIGGGPAGVAAGVYASRKRLKTVFITKEWGGQSVVSEGIENWIGTVKISGMELAENLKNHLLAYAADIVEVVEGELVAKVEKSAEGFHITTDGGKSFDAKTVLITAGSHRRKLEVPGATALEHKGITYCASCDGPLFAGKDVAVIGGGNAGFETAAQLMAYCPHVYLLHRRREFRADPVTVERVLKNPAVKAITPVEPIEVKGEKFVTALVYKNVETGETTELPVGGIFVEIGSVPSTEYVKGLVELNQYGQVVVDPRTQRARLLQTPEIASDARRGVRLSRKELFAIYNRA
ncbi:MAG: alkyl hydroperoxide reductase, large subunit, partial [Parcubacteria group bacterium Gr01-1014_72]